MIDSIEKNKCTGCQMCADICPVNAIEYVTDSEGFWYPKVDSKKCIKCQKCLKTCPSLNKLETTKNSPKIYKTWIKDKEIRLKSTSGGIFFAVAQYIIKNGGYVVGCVYGDDYKSAKHIVGNTMEDLKRIMGSKYFQSNLSGIYKKTKTLLDNKEKVLFVGTPCQVSALQSFLGKDYENLITMDFICRGINSPMVFKKFVEELEEKYDSKVIYARLKDKRTGWSSLASYLKFQNGKEYHADKNKDLWIQGYVKFNLYMRKNCSQCAYKTLPRVSDLSMGDFWGIRNQSKEDMFNGISLLFVNSTKGNEILKNIQDIIELEERELNEAIKYNPCIIKSAKYDKKRDKFFKLIQNNNFSTSVKKCIKTSLIKRIIMKFKRILKKILFLTKNIDLFKFIYLNFFSKQIIRDRKCYFMPYKNSVIELHKTSRIYIKNSSIYFGTNKIKGSKAETYLRMDKNAKWISNNGANIFYNVTIEIKNNAELNTKYFSVNSGSVIISAKKITIGEDVMLGRNNIIYDSDFHKLLDENYNIKNLSKEVVIKDHVWITSDVIVQKGVTIGKNSIITAKSLVRKDIESNYLAGNQSTATTFAKALNWSREILDVGENNEN